MVILLKLYIVKPLVFNKLSLSTVIHCVLAVSLPSGQGYWLAIHGPRLRPTGLHYLQWLCMLKVCGTEIFTYWKDVDHGGLWQLKWYLMPAQRACPKSSPIVWCCYTIIHAYMVHSWGLYPTAVLWLVITPESFWKLKRILQFFGGNVIILFLIPGPWCVRLKEESQSHNCWGPWTQTDSISTENHDVQQMPLALVHQSG